jgi:hypothetical protein
MRIVHVEDDRGKISKLARAVPVDETYTNSAELAEFMRGSDSNPGMVVLDVGVFSEETPDGMLRKGEELSDNGWRVIFWSSSVGALNVRDDCWFENRVDKAGFDTLVNAIRARPETSGLCRGSKPHRRELALELLSALWACGLHWETLLTTNRNASLNEAVSRVDESAFSDLGRIIIGQVRDRVSGGKSPKPPRELRPMVSNLDELLARAASDGESVGRWSRARVTDPPADVESAVKVMSESVNPAWWNARLEALRDALLPGA